MSYEKKRCDVPAYYAAAVKFTDDENKSFDKDSVRILGNIYLSNKSDARSWFHHTVKDLNEAEGVLFDEMGYVLETYDKSKRKKFNKAMYKVLELWKAVN